MDLNTKAPIRLIAGPADGLVLSVPAHEIPPFFAFGSTPLARYERESGDGESYLLPFLRGFRALLKTAGRSQRLGIVKSASAAGLITSIRRAGAFHVNADDS